LQAVDQAIMLVNAKRQKRISEITARLESTDPISDKQREDSKKELMDLCSNASILEAKKKKLESEFRLLAQKRKSTEADASRLKEAREQLDAEINKRKEEDKDLSQFANKVKDGDIHLEEFRKVGFDFDLPTHCSCCRRKFQMTKSESEGTCSRIMMERCNCVDYCRQCVTTSITRCPRHNAPVGQFVPFTTLG